MTIPFLLNERAGALHAGPDSGTLRSEAGRIGLDAEYIVTTSPAHLRETVRALARDGAETVVVVGGDGTVHTAVQELARTATALGIVPQGTANNFATALGIPADIPGALAIIAAGRPRSVDLGRVGNCWFLEAAGVGLFADALASYGRHTGKSLFRFLFAVGRVFLTMHARRLRLTLDGSTETERAMMCTVANASRMGLTTPMAPEAKLNDGRFDVVIVGDLTRLEMITYYRALMRGAHMDLPKVSMARARHVAIEARRPMSVHCDDHVVGTTPAVLTSEAGALRVLAGSL